MVEFFDLPAAQVDPRCSILASDMLEVTVIELGSGTGYVGLKLSERLFNRLRRHLVILTDLPDVCPLLRENLAKLQEKQARSSCDTHRSVVVSPLSWGNADETLQLWSSCLAVASSGPQQGQLHAGRKLTHIICSDLVSSFNFN